jgi:hypothetical protein
VPTGTPEATAAGWADRTWLGLACALVRGVADAAAVARLVADHTRELTGITQVQINTRA